jgi:hypothetical protein
MMLHAFQHLPFAMTMLTSSLARAILAIIQKNKLLSLVRNACGLRHDRVEVRDGLLPARFRERRSRSSVAKSLKTRSGTIQRRSSWNVIRTTVLFKCVLLFTNVASANVEGQPRTSPAVLVVTLTPRVSSCRGSDRRDKMTLRYRSEYDPDFTPTHMKCDISFEYPCNAI